MNILLPTAISVLVPAVFLFLVRRLDLYASGSVRSVLLCMGGGLAAFPLSFVVNTGTYRFLALGMGGAAAVMAVKTVVAPVVEEMSKSALVTWYSRRPEFTYFVDGAIYGFAAGTAFAIVENLFYLQRAHDLLAMSVNRAFSSSLMHGSASALVGVAVGRARFGRGAGRWLSLVLGWMAAMAVHTSFNHLVNAGPMMGPRLLMAVGVGLGGVALTMGFIRWGLWEEARWLRESLTLDIGVSGQESGLVQRWKELDVLLAPIGAHFGPEKRAMADRFLRLQAQLGLKSKAAAKAEDPALKSGLERQALDLRARMDDARRELGVYCMAYIRSIVPPEGEPIWQALESRLADDLPSEGKMWGLLADRAGGAPAHPGAL